MQGHLYYLVIVKRLRSESSMETNSNVLFDWQGNQYQGIISKEYDNSVLIEVCNPDVELKDKYLGRIIISKKDIKKQK